MEIQPTDKRQLKIRYRLFVSDSQEASRFFCPVFRPFVRRCPQTFILQADTEFVGIIVGVSDYDNRSEAEKH